MTPNAPIGSADAVDPIAAFYERHPYPPPVADLNRLTNPAVAADERRAAECLVWPRRPFPPAGRRLLIAGCGTSQAARHALLNPTATVVGIDVSQTSIDHTRRLIKRHHIDNLEVRRLAVEEVGRLDGGFDHIVCTGVLHHLADPDAGLAALGGALAPGGALTLMVYARYGRTGVYLMQEYCRRLGVTTSPADLAELVATMRELPAGHPIGRLLRETADFHDDDALADALLNPRDRAYSVPELMELLDRAGLRFGRWARQAPYLPDCGSISETPHASVIGAMPPAEQFAALELFRGTMTRHTVIASAGDEPAGQLDFASADVGSWVPFRVATATAVQDRVPPGAAAALLNRAHEFNDLVMFVDQAEFDLYRAIDGHRSIAELGDGAACMVERLWHHDLVLIDASGTA